MMLNIYYKSMPTDVLNRYISFGQKLRKKRKKGIKSSHTKFTHKNLIIISLKCVVASETQLAILFTFIL